MELKDMLDLRAEAVRRKAKKGDYAGGKCPYGYKPQRGHLLINPHEAEAVKFMFKLRDKGASYGYICAQLDANHVKTRKGGSFSRSMVARIVNNRKFYQGYYKYADIDWVKGRHYPILRDEE